MGEGTFHHRATLKQTNKSFKSRHSTKHALKERSKGRVERESPKRTPSSAVVAAQKRTNRRNAAKQAQSNKRQALVSATRIFNGVDGAPRIVAIISLSDDVRGRDAVVSLAKSLDIETHAVPASGLWRMRSDRFKTSIQFMILPYGSFYGTLDAVKVADYCIFLLSPSEEVTPWGENLLRTLQAQGIPSSITAMVPSLSASPPAVKEHSSIQKSLLSFIKYFIPSQSKVFNFLEGAAMSETLNAIRALCEGKPSEVRWREGRPYLVAEEMSWKQKDETSPNLGTLSVTGVVRGAPLSANRLVHLPGIGDFQVSHITSSPTASTKGRPGAAGMEVEPSSTTVHVRSATDADSLVSTNHPDDMANEQTWPGEDEMREGHDTVQPIPSDLPDAPVGTTPKIIKRVPKGTSAYQAAWIVDDEEEDGASVEDSDPDDDAMSAEAEDPNQGGSAVAPGAEEEDEMEDLDLTNTAGADKDVAFEDLDAQEETKQLHSWRNRSREEAEDASFPDEVDTPQEVAARVRFQRYRGLRSFRTSPWDPYENLPRDYARIFQFQDFKHIERSIIKRSMNDLEAAQPGMRVTLHIANAPDLTQGRRPSEVLSIFGLLQHEHKVSVQNFKVQRDTECDAIVRSKDPLILCVGPRRFSVRPIYSQHTRGGGKGVNNVHKFERFLRHGQAYVATIYGAVTFGHQPCILLREDSQGPKIVASGAFMNADTTRVIAKRIILTGHPFKVHKRTATVRYMFFNPEDVMYYAPIQLHTKLGRTGHIKESLGTHGYLKAHFDGPLSQMDTVCMSLYKRVYPKWAEVWRGGEGSHDGPAEDRMEE